MDRPSSCDWEQRMSQDEIFHTNKTLVLSGQTHNGPSGFTFTSPQPNSAASRSFHPVHQQTEQEYRRGCTNTLKHHGNFVVAEGGNTLRKADHFRAFGRCVASNVRVPSSARASFREYGVMIQEKRKAHVLDGSSEQTKRFRAVKWSDKETEVLLKSKLDVFERANSKGKPAERRHWSKEVSELLLKNYGSDRSCVSCRQRWDTMKKIFNDICEHDSKIHLCGSNGIRFWEMSDDQRKECVKMNFLWEWYVLVKRILLVEADMNDPVKKYLRPRRRTRSTQVGANNALTSPNVSTIGADPSSTQDQVSTMIPPVASIVPYAHLGPSIQQCYQDEVFKDVVPDGAELDENKLIAKLAPIISKQIEAALEPLKLALSRLLPNSLEDTIPYGAQAGVVNFNAGSDLEYGDGLQDFDPDMVFEDGATF